MSQSITFDAVPSVTVGGIGTISASGGASGQPVIFTSTTPSFCTVSGTTVTGVAVGQCTVAANQAGNGTYSAAPQVTQNIVIAAAASYALTVNAVGASNVAIGATPGSYAGTTPYSKTNIAPGTSITLSAPASLEGVVFGSWSGCDSVLGVTCKVTMELSVIKSATTKGITANYHSLMSQTIAFGAAPTDVKVGGTGVLNAIASSGLAVTFSSTTPGICTVTDTTVSGLAVGLCTVAANQAGDSNTRPAPEMRQSFNIELPLGAAAPNPPTMTSITEGAGSATIYFSPSSNTGGSSISHYTATCTASSQPTRSTSGAGSPMTIRNLSGGVAYQCTLTATNAWGLTSAASASLSVTPLLGKKSSSIAPILMLLLD